MADKKTPAVRIELTDADLRVAYNTWVAAKEARDAAEEAMNAAAEVLKPIMREADATVATVAGTPVLRLVNSSRVTFDAAVLRKLAPAAAKKAEKVSAFDYLRKA